MKSGFEPLLTTDPEEARRLVEDKKPRLVLLDLMLPGTDGIELMREIGLTANVLVIFVSAYGQDQLVARAFDAGAAAYVVKPFSPTELVARIRAVPAQARRPAAVGALCPRGPDRRLRGAAGDACGPAGAV